MSDAGIVTALSHPLRARILAVFDDQEASPKGVADELNEKLGNVSYHVRILRELGLIELTRTEPRRGALEHFYRSRVREHGTLNVEFALTKAGWAEVDRAIEKFQRDLARIAKRHAGGSTQRVVAAVLPE